MFLSPVVPQSYQKDLSPADIPGHTLSADPVVPLFQTWTHTQPADAVCQIVSQADTVLLSFSIQLSSRIAALFLQSPVVP